MLVLYFLLFEIVIQTTISDTSFQDHFSMRAGGLSRVARGNDLEAQGLCA